MIWKLLNNLTNGLAKKYGGKGQNNSCERGFGMTDKITNKLDQLERIVEIARVKYSSHIMIQEIESLQALINVARASHVFFTRWVEVFPTIEPNGAIDNLNKALKELGEL